MNRYSQKVMRAWVGMGSRFLPFADVATPDLPLSRLLRAVQIRPMPRTFSRLGLAAQRIFLSHHHHNGQFRRRDIHCLSPPCLLFFLCAGGISGGIFDFYLSKLWFYIAM